MAVSHSPSIVANGLVLCLDAANPKSYNVGIATTAFNDLTGNGNNGGLIGGIGYENKNGGILRFDGVNDYVDCGPASAIGSSLTGLTVNVWINPSVKATKCIAENGTSFNTNTFYVFQENENYFTFAVWGGVGLGYDVVYANFIYETNTWYNLTGVWSSGSRVELYCNGVLCSGTRQGTLQNSVINGNTNLLLGSRNYGSFPFAGKYAYASFYNRALTAAEVLQNYNALKSRFINPVSEIITNGLVLNLDAGNTKSYSGSGTTWTNLLGTGNNGTLVNGPTYSSANGGSIVFDGVDDYVNAGNLGSFYSQGTISYWMNSSAVENYRNTFSTHYLGGNKGIRFEQYTTGAFYVVIGNDAGSYGFYDYTPGANISANTWYNVVLVWNTSTNNVVGYLNNSQKFNSTHTLWATTLPSISIGSGYNASRYFKGNISNIQIYNRALTAAEVQENYFATKSRFGLL